MVLIRSWMMISRAVEMAEQDLMTITEASARYGFSRSMIRTWLERGRLPGRVFGRTWTISKADLEAFLAKPRPTGRPPKRRRRKKVEA